MKESFSKALDKIKKQKYENWTINPRSIKKIPDRLKKKMRIK
jgi:hypothetical protein